VLVIPRVIAYIQDDRETGGGRDRRDRRRRARDRDRSPMGLSGAGGSQAATAQVLDGCGLAWRRQASPRCTVLPCPV